MITFEKIDPNNTEQANVYISWCSDPVLIKNWTLHKESTKAFKYSAQDFKDDFSHTGKIAFMIKLNLKYIGYGSFFINHPACIHKEGKICWPSLAIGNSIYRGKGFGIQICKEIFRLATELDCTHIEAGIFEFNEEIKKILLDNNFKLIGEIPNITFIDNKWWKAEHYLFKI